MFQVKLKIALWDLITSAPMGVNCYSMATWAVIPHTYFNGFFLFNLTYSILCIYGT